MSFLAFIFSQFLTSHRQLLADPTSFEEPLLDTVIVIVLQGNSILSISQLGLATSVNQECIELAKARQEIIYRILD